MQKIKKYKIKKNIKKQKTKNKIKSKKRKDKNKKIIEKLNKINIKK